jgi:hypothetical protein
MEMLLTLVAANARDYSSPASAARIDISVAAPSVEQSLLEVHGAAPSGLVTAPSFRFGSFITMSPGVISRRLGAKKEPYRGRAQTRFVYNGLRD